MSVTGERDTRLEVPHEHEGDRPTIGCPGCIRAVKVAEYQLYCERLPIDELIDASSLDSVPWSWHDRVADEVLDRRFPRPDA